MILGSESKARSKLCDYGMENGEYRNQTFPTIIKVCGDVLC